MDIKFVDLFCGIGSVNYSCRKFGWKCISACDINKTVRQTYTKNYNEIPLGDITSIDPGDIQSFDVLCAGFPCQPYSIIGQHQGSKDSRGTLVQHIMKFVIYHKPKVIILENVAGLLSHDEGKTFEKIKKDISEQNYNITYEILKCSDYGIPQMRKRLFI